MTSGYYLVALVYALFLMAVGIAEWLRTRSRRPDMLSVFLVVTLLQCAVPAVVMFGLLPVVDTTAPTTNPVFDRILLSLNYTSVFAVLGLTIWFIIFVYAGVAITRLLLPEPGASRSGPKTLTVKPGRLLVLLLLGFLLTLYSFYGLGDTLLMRYTNLILYRAGYEGIERTALNANAFALTQTWSWLTVVLLVAVRERRGRGLLWGCCVLVLVIFALAGVSRRALFLPVLLVYLITVLHKGKWYPLRLAFAALPILVIVAFGKDALAAIAWGGEADAVVRTYATSASAILRGTVEVGITVVESLGTFLFIELPPRLGIDHVLSIARRFPDGLLGLNLEFPERIVRISTEALAGAAEQDMPPGLLGQMWLDFRILGPPIWGLIFGLQVGIAQFFYERVKPTAQSAAVFAVVMFVIALPMNTGSLDFTFSVDIAALLLGLALCVQVGRTRMAAIRPADVFESDSRLHPDRENDD